MGCDYQDVRLLGERAWRPKRRLIVASDPVHGIVVVLDTGLRVVARVCLPGECDDT